MSLLLYRYNVRANAVAYGWIDTRITQPPTESKVLSIDGQEIKLGIPMNAKKWRDVSDIPLARPGTADEAARVMLFLASPLSSCIAGTCVECTGGVLCEPITDDLADEFYVTHDNKKYEYNSPCYLVY